MNVYFYPIDNNPYQKLLKQSLETIGIHVELVSTVWLMKRIFSFKRGENIVFHLHWLPSGIVKKAVLFLFLLKCKIVGVPVVWTIHNLVSHDTKYHKAEVLLRSFLAEYFASTLIIHGNNAKELVKEKYKVSEDKLSVMMHGNYTSLYSDITNLSSDMLMSIPDDNLVITFFGHVKPYKGVEKLITSFRDVLGDNPKVSLLIAGKPINEEYANILMGMTKELVNVHLELRFIQESEIPLIMKRSNMLVFPFSEVLTSGSIVLGAGFSKPIIAKNRGVISEYLGNRSLLYSNDEELAETLVRACQLGSRELEAIGHENGKFIRQFTWEKAAQSLKIDYIDLLD